MVFHYTNFVAETNIWWIRRIRPVIEPPLNPPLVISCGFWSVVHMDYVQILFFREKFSNKIFSIKIPILLKTCTY